MFWLEDMDKVINERVDILKTSLVSHHRSRQLLTLSPTCTEATNDAVEAMTARAIRGWRNLIMVLKQIVVDTPPREY